MSVPSAAYRNEVCGSAAASDRASRRVGRSQAEAPRAKTSKATTRVRERTAMVHPSCHAALGPTASILEPMGPADLPALLAGPAEVVPPDALPAKLALGRPLRAPPGPG